ncbi:MAG: phage minor capsid protein [Candidatus Limiplasma sp.]|nr:phage minor capsid protein [Candidatus Limiplasma sp.]
MRIDPLRFSDAIVRVYEACVDELLVNLARHFNVGATGNIPTFDYEVELLAKMGAIRKETAKIIARHVVNNEPMIVEAVKTAMLDALKDVEPEFAQAARAGMLSGTDMEVLDGIQDQLAAYSRQAVKQTNLVNTVMLEGTMEAYRKGIYAATDIVRQLGAAQTVLNAETGKVITGTSTLQEAVRSGVRAMHEAGITGFIDHGGHKWSAEAYVRMDLKTTCSNAANQAVMTRNEQYGNDLIWVNTNATARPGCYPWQGKVISMANRARVVTDGYGRRVQAYAASQTTYGQPDGIYGINCHHGPMNVFIPGMSVVRGQASAPSKEASDKIYQLTQEQRRMERQVRYAKREAAMLDAAGDKEGFEKAALRVKERQAKLKAFVNEHEESLVLRGDRTQVYGWDASMNAKATQATRRREKEKSKN